MKYLVFVSLICAAQTLFADSLKCTVTNNKTGQVAFYGDFADAPVTSIKPRRFPVSSVKTGTLVADGSPLQVVFVREWGSYEGAKIIDLYEGPTLLATEVETVDLDTDSSASLVAPKGQFEIRCQF